MIIAVDFDGTCVTHEFPKVGKDIGAVTLISNKLFKTKEELLKSLWLTLKNIIGKLYQNTHTGEIKRVVFINKYYVTLKGVLSDIKSPICYMEHTILVYKRKN